MIDALKVIQDRNASIRLTVTLTERELAGSGHDYPEWVRPIGRVTDTEISREFDKASVVFFPCIVESFGYPLAEARVRRLPVVAPNNPLSREVAGDALVGYSIGSRTSLTSALIQALDTNLSSLTQNPYDPDRYFQSLLSVNQ